MSENQAVAQHFDDEERAFVAQVLDWLTQASQDYQLVLTHFLNPRERHIVSIIVGDRTDIQVHSYGIFDRAEKKRLVIAPEFFEVGRQDFEELLLQIRFAKKFINLRHKDLLGALLAAGVNRSVIGDIVVDQDLGLAQLAVEKSHQIFLTQTVDQIGKAKVHFEQVADSKALVPAVDEEERFVLIPSLRLDAVIAACFGISRTQVSEMISRGFISVNWVKNDDASRLMHRQDVVSVRKYGRIRLQSLAGQSKRDKIKAVFQIIRRWVEWYREGDNMALTPDEILNHEFTRKGSRAYVAREVDSFLDEVNNDYRAMIVENEELKKQIRQQQEKIDQLEGQKDQVNESILFAQSAASRLRSETEEEVKIQLEKAQQEAKEIVETARNEAEAESRRLAQENVDLIDEQNELRSHVDSFKQSFIQLIDEQKALLEKDELAKAVESLPASALSNKVLEETEESLDLPTDLTDIPDFAKGPIEPAGNETVSISAEEANANPEKSADPTVVVFPESEEK